MLDDMRMRKLAGKTQAAYVRALYRLVAFLQRSPDTASAEDLRRFQLDMVDGGASPITVNANRCGAIGLPLRYGSAPAIAWPDRSRATDR